MERHRNMCGMKMIYFPHFRFPSSGAHWNTSVREGENRKERNWRRIRFRLFIAIFFLLKSYCFVLRWRFHSPFDVSLEMRLLRFCGKSGREIYYACIWIPVQGVSILAILVCNRGWFLHSRLQLNKKAILMKCEKWTYWHDTSKSIYILNWISNFWLRHK